MPLPPDARRRLARPLRESVAENAFLWSTSTLPATEAVWLRHAGRLDDAVRSFVEHLHRAPGTDFNSARQWTQELLRHREVTARRLAVLAPFQPFDASAARGLAGQIDRAVLAAADSLEDGLAEWATAEFTGWSTMQGSAFAERDRDLVELAFGLDKPMRDEDGAFRPDWVLQAFAYDNWALLTVLVPHLGSIGLLQVTDLLAGVSVVGHLVASDDPLAAWDAGAEFLRSTRNSEPSVRRAVLSHLDRAESAMTRASELARRRLTESRKTALQEDHAWSVAEAYKRVCEGPLRQFAWALLALKQQRWGATPTLGPLTDRLRSAEGVLAELARDALLPEMRNAEAHETLVWDGFTDEYVLEASRLSVARVSRATAASTSFVTGCRAAETAYRAMAAAPYSTALPSFKDGGRLPVRHRVEAFFGTNRIRLLRATVSGPVAAFEVERLGEEDVNPCLQALTLAHRLLPRAVRFEVRVPTSSEPVVAVSSDALERTVAVWTIAVSALNRMPFSTFLPANLDARSRYESPSVARRSVAWIAVDDVLDAVDGSPQVAPGTRRATLLKRLEVVEAAASMTRQALEVDDARLRDVGRSVADLQTRLDGSRGNPLADLQKSPEVVRLRLQWASWGPVTRLPPIVERSGTPQLEPQPRLRPRVPAIFRSI